MKKVFSLLLVVFAMMISSFLYVEAADIREVQALHILVNTEDEANQIREEILAGQTKNEVFYNFMNAEIYETVKTDGCVHLAFANYTGLKVAVLGRRYVENH